MDSGAGEAVAADVTRTDPVVAWRDVATDRVGLALLVTAAATCAVLLREELVHPGHTLVHEVAGLTLVLGGCFALRHRVDRRIRVACMYLAVGAALAISLRENGFATPNQFVIAGMLVILAGILLGGRLALATLGLFVLTICAVAAHFVLEKPALLGRTDVYEAGNWLRITLVFAAAAGATLWAVSQFAAWLGSALDRSNDARHALELETAERMHHKQRELELEEQLRQASVHGSLATLSGGIARDFKNLLSVTLHGAALASSEEHPEDREAALDLVLNTARRGMALADRLLEYSRGQSARQHWLDANDTISDTLPLIQQLFPPNIEIQFQRGNAVGHMRTAPGQLDQLLLNLCTDARDEMPGGGVLRLRTGRVEDDGRDEVVLSVARQVETMAVSRASGEGSGMGSYVTRPPAVSDSVRELVQQMGGRVEFRSTTSGGGEITVALPRGAPPEPVPLRRNGR